MSERDDDYLWSGQGPASDDLVKLETLLGGEKLREPLRARPRRPVLFALALAGLAAAAAFALTRHDRPPTSWIAAILPGLSGDEIQGAVFEFSLVDDAPPAGWQTAVERRIADLGAPSSLRFEGDRVIVDYADAWPLELDAALSRRGDFAIQEVIESSPLMRALYTRVSEGDPLARELGVTAEIDGWDHDESGRRFTDWYLTAASPQVLDAYLRAVRAENPRLEPDSAHTFAFEPMRQDLDGPKPPRWRSYYLDRTVWLSNEDIANAYVYWNSDTNRPEVLVEYTAEGAARFADLTGRIVGRKLAILLDGEVSSAPVVQDRVTGGRTSIMMGGGDAQKVQQEAQDLVGVLRASQHPLPVALHLDKLTIRAEALTDGQLVAARAGISLLFGLLVFAGAFALERTSRPIDPEVSRVRGRARRRSLPWVRFLITAAGVAAAILAERIPVASDVDWAELGGLHVSLFALGIMPAISAFLLVELAALAVPRWRVLRRGGPSARARLGSATALLTIALALVQAWMVADFMVSVPPLAHLSRAMLVISFTGGTLVMTFLALVLSRYGIANGFAVLLLAGQGALWYRAIDFLAPGAGNTALVLPFVATVIATALATAWILRHRVRGPSAASSIRLPTAGIVPLAILPSLLGLFALVWPEVAGRLGIWWQDNVSRPGSGLLVELGFLVAIGVALSWLFSRPARLGDATAGTPRPHGLLIGVGLSIAYLLLLALLGRWSSSVLSYFGITLVSVAVATAVVMDLVAEWRAFARRDDLVPVWPLHQVQRVDLVTGALGKNEIDVHTRGLYLRLLLHFFGPFVPVLLYVPAAQAEEARAIIRAQLDVK